MSPKNRAALKIVRMGLDALEEDDFETASQVIATGAVLFDGNLDLRAVLGELARTVGRMAAARKLPHGYVHLAKENDCDTALCGVTLASLQAHDVLVHAQATFEAPGNMRCVACAGKLTAP